MNKQGKIAFNQELGLWKVKGGIEWVKTIGDDGNEYQGYTSNPIGGCFHRCRWRMPGGQVAICYAESVADRLAQKRYTSGFEHIYIDRGELAKWATLGRPSRIFIDSMSDMFGAWIPDSDILGIIRRCQALEQHTFLTLTKNPKRLKKFVDFYPPNMHLGVSSAPDFMNGNELSRDQQERYMIGALESLRTIHDRVTWFSFEPLSWDMSDIIKAYPGVINWAVIGAASDGPKKFQPERAHVQNLLDVLDTQGVPVFFKGNLDWDPWREDYPTNWAFDYPVYRVAPDGFGQSEADYSKPVTMVGV